MYWLYHLEWWWEVCDLVSHLTHQSLMKTHEFSDIRQSSRSKSGQFWNISPVYLMWHHKNARWLFCACWNDPLFEQTAQSCQGYARTTFQFTIFVLHKLGLPTFDTEVVAFGCKPGIAIHPKAFSCIYNIFYCSYSSIPFHWTFYFRIKILEQNLKWFKSVVPFAEKPKEWGFSCTGQNCWTLVNTRARVPTMEQNWTQPNTVCNTTLFPQKTPIVPGISWLVYPLFGKRICKSARHQDFFYRFCSRTTRKCIPSISHNFEWKYCMEVIQIFSKTQWDLPKRHQMYQCPEALLKIVSLESILMKLEIIFFDISRNISCSSFREWSATVSALLNQNRQFLFYPSAKSWVELADIDIHVAHLIYL